MYCVRCGTLNADSASFCSQCGASLTGAAADSTAATDVAPGAQAVYAGFWLRVAACLVDGVVLTAAYFVLVFALAFGLLAPGPEPKLAESMIVVLGVWLLSVAIPWLYVALMESSAKQATLGKMACGIKVTDLTGNRISFGRATGRHFAEWITGFTFLIGYVMAAFTQRRQTLHDLIAATVVVPRQASPSAVAGSAPAMRLPGWAIAVIIIAGTLVPIGILAAIAIPAFQDYTIRTEVTEGLKLAAQYKEAVLEHRERTGDWPSDVEATGYAEWANSVVSESMFVSQVEISNGTITITYGKKSDSRIVRKKLALRPYVLEFGDVGWQCGNAEPPADGTPSSLGGITSGTISSPGRTTVPDRFLPAKCRSGYVTGSEEPMADQPGSV
jgi:uncharacterized RDD family membrane protein YckC